MTTTDMIAVRPVPAVAVEFRVGQWYVLPGKGGRFAGRTVECVRTGRVWTEVRAVSGR